MNLIFLDTETTGLDSDPYARLCQIAYKTGDEMVNELYKPPVEIGLGAMAVHHITEAMVKDKSPFAGSSRQKILKELASKKSNIFIAHNAKFDMEMLRREDVNPKSQICSLKVAHAVLKEDENKPKNFKLQTLRYHFGIELNDAKAHDAQGDVEVLEKVFAVLLEKASAVSAKKAAAKGRAPYTQKEILERMIELTMAADEPVTVMTFGKHQGKSIEAMIAEDRRYCEWLVGNANNPNDNVIRTIRVLLTK